MPTSNPASVAIYAAQKLHSRCGEFAAHQYATHRGASDVLYATAVDFEHRRKSLRPWQREALRRNFDRFCNWLETR